MKIVLGTHTTADTTLGCDYCLIDLTPKVAQEILKKIEITHSVDKGCRSNVSRVEFFSSEQIIGFFEQCEAVEEIQDDAHKLAENVWNAESVEFPEDVFYKTECERLIVYANRNDDPTIFWACNPKHSDVRIETDYLPIKIIKNIANDKAKRIAKLVRLLANFTKDGELNDPEDLKSRFTMDPADAIETLHNVIDLAREIIAMED